MWCKELDSMIIVGLFQLEIFCSGGFGDDEWLTTMNHSKSWSVFSREVTAGRKKSKPSLWASGPWESVFSLGQVLVLFKFKFNPQHLNLSLLFQENRGLQSPWWTSVCNCLICSISAPSDYWIISTSGRGKLLLNLLLIFFIADYLGLEKKKKKKE